MTGLLKTAISLFLLSLMFVSFMAMLSGCASDSDRCLEYGFVPGTEGWANCRMNLDLHG
jgi:hypothetical protein